MTTTAKYNLVKLVIFTLTLPLAVVVSTHLARSSFEKVRLNGQTIRVKGYAEKPIVSDRAEWTTSITTRHLDRTTAYQKLALQRIDLLKYLEASGYAKEKVAMAPVRIRIRYKRDARQNLTNEIEQYEIEQSYTIADKDVHRLSKTAKDASHLIAEGIELESSSPSYLYTKLNDLKLDMLAAATLNARERAGKLVSASSNTLGQLRYASQGVFQITPAFSNDVSNSGYNDTSSLNKMIKAVVTVEYAIN